MKSIKIISILSVIFFSFKLPAQTWIRYYGFGSPNLSSYVIEYYDKGYVIAGNNTYKYGWIIKTDINGYKLWDVKIGNGSYDCMINNIEQTQDNGLIIAGEITKYDQNYDDPLLIKLNRCGEMEWCKVLNFPGNDDYGINVKCTPDGGYVLLTINYTSEPNRKVHLFKFDGIGDLVWQKEYISDSLVFGDYVRSLYFDNEDFLITGECYYPNPGDSTGGWMRPYYIQTDTSGNENWWLVYSQNTGFYYVGDAYATTRDNHGNYYSVGYNLDNTALLKFDKHGYELYSVDLIPNIDAGTANVIIWYDNKTLIINNSWLIGANWHYGLSKTDTLGIISKTKEFPDPNHSGLYWTTKTFDGKILSVGENFIGAQSRIVAFKVNSNLEYDSIYTKPRIYDSLCPDSIHSYTFDPNCDVIVGIDKPMQNPQTHQMKVFPNPANEKVTLEFPKYIIDQSGCRNCTTTTVYYNWDKTILEVFNINSKLIFTQKIPRNQKELELDVSKWGKGIYFLRLSFNGKPVTSSKLIII